MPIIDMIPSPPPSINIGSWTVLLKLALFVALFSFKPSEPYLSQYLICDQATRAEACADSQSKSVCLENTQCLWSVDYCTLLPCSSINATQCAITYDYNDPFNYCELEGDQCVNSLIIYNSTLLRLKFNNEFFSFQV
jgi:hypothetical protein